jgi:glutamate carboxypeptidase
MVGLSPTESAVLAQIEGDAMFDQVQAWSAINSGSHNHEGLAKVATLLGDAFSALPGNLKLEEAQRGEIVTPAGSIEPVEYGQNLHLTVRPNAPMQILLTGHMDTVFGVDHPFQSLAWREAGIIGGPGVADMKGGLAVMLAALGAVEAAPDADRLGYEVVINSDEELGSPGSAQLIAAAARSKSAAFTYEPAILPDGTLAGARPGSGNFSILVVGRSAHAGRNPQDGRNAIVAAADLTLRLAGLHRDGLIVNPARIDGGSANNVVPDRAVLRVNLRPRAPSDQHSAIAALDLAVAAVARAHDVQISIHGGFGRPPKPLDPASLKLFGLVRDCSIALGHPIAWRDSGGVCDGNNIAALGVPVVDTMGVRGGAIHSADEYLIVDSLAERARLSALALMRLASGDPM